MLQDLHARPGGVAVEQFVEPREPVLDPGRMRLSRRCTARRLEDRELRPPPLELAVELAELVAHDLDVVAFGLVIGDEAHQIPRLALEPRDLRRERLGPGPAPSRRDLHARVHELGEPLDRLRRRRRLAESLEERALEQILAVPHVVAADGGPLVLRARAAVPDLVVDTVAFPARRRLRHHRHTALRALATLLREDFVQAYGRELPAVVQCFADDFDACIAHLRFPLRHRKVIRTTNLLERLFLEERRRTKIIPHAFGERPVLKLMYAAVIRAADRWRGLIVGEFEQRQLRAIREDLNRAHVERTRPAVRPIPGASPSKLSSKVRT
ncbi:MAG: transposase [Candidatus Rokuibacteriota bacterium]